MSTEAQVALPAVRRRTRTVPDRVLGALGAGMMILAVVLLIRGGESDGGGRPLAAPPAVLLLEPSAGAVVEGPLSLVFTMQEELARQPSGWGVGGFHLHLQMDHLELMPGPTDVEALASGRYRWTVGNLEPGPHRLRIFWSDASHRPVEGGDSEEVTIVAR